MILDVAAAVGTIMVVDAEQAIRIIDVLTSMDYRVQHNGHAKQKKGVLKQTTTEALLAQHIETLTKQMSKLPQQLHVINCATID